MTGVVAERVSIAEPQPFCHVDEIGARYAEGSEEVSVAVAGPKPEADGVALVDLANLANAAEDVDWFGVADGLADG
jgi:hypothetical protein